MAGELEQQVQVLRDRVTAVRADAAGLREKLGDRFQAGGSELGIANDRALKVKLAADQKVQAADAMTATMQGELVENRNKLLTTEAEHTVAVALGDTAKAQHLEELTDGYRRMIGEREARLQAAQDDAAAAQVEAGEAARGLAEATLSYDEFYVAVGASEAEIDKIENQAELIEQARLKLFEAEVMYGDEPPAGADVDEWFTGRAELEGEAAALLWKADAIVVDRRVIAEVVPEADDHVAPLPMSDDLMDPNDEDALGLDGVDDPDAGEAAEIESVDEVAVPTTTHDLDQDEDADEDAGADWVAVGGEIAGLDLTQQPGWGSGDDAASDEWHSTVHQDAEDVDDQPSDHDGF